MAAVLRLRQPGLRRSADSPNMASAAAAVHFHPEHRRGFRSPRSSYFFCCLRAWPF